MNQELAASATAWRTPPAGRVRFSPGRNWVLFALTTCGPCKNQAGKADGHVVSGALDKSSAVAAGSGLLQTVRCDAQEIACRMVHWETSLAAVKQAGPRKNQRFDGTAIQARCRCDLLGKSRRMVSIGTQRVLVNGCRSDIPEEMEQAVAALAVFLAGGGETVKSLTR